MIRSSADSTKHIFYCLNMTEIWDITALLQPYTLLESVYYKQILIIFFSQKIQTK
jgi:hypothetical protein